MGLLSENNDPKNNGELHEGFNLGLDPDVEKDVKEIISRNSIFAEPKGEGSGSSLEEKITVGASDGNSILDSAFKTTQEEAYAHTPNSGISYPISDPSHSRAQGLAPGYGSTSSMPGNAEGLGKGELQGTEGEHENLNAHEKNGGEKSGNELKHGENLWPRSKEKDAKDGWEGAEQFKETVLEY